MPGVSLKTTKLISSGKRRYYCGGLLFGWSLIFIHEISRIDASYKSLEKQHTRWFNKNYRVTDSRNRKYQSCIWEKENFLWCKMLRLITTLSLLLMEISNYFFWITTLDNSHAQIQKLLWPFKRNPSSALLIHTFSLL